MIMSAFCCMYIVIYQMGVLTLSITKTMLGTNDYNCIETGGG
jgi:hypothetical protein